MSNKSYSEYKRLKEIVERAELVTEKDVEDFFIAYTLYIHNYGNIGAIYNCYSDDVVVHSTAGNLAGAEGEISHTAWSLNAAPDFEIVFQDFMAHKVDDNTFKFIQVTSRNHTISGPTVKGNPTGKKLSEDNLITMCECLVERVNGRWLITGEWVAGSDKTMEWSLTEEPVVEEDFQEQVIIQIEE